MCRDLAAARRGRDSEKLRDPPARPLRTTLSVGGDPAGTRRTILPVTASAPVLACVSSSASSQCSGVSQSSSVIAVQSASTMAVSIAMPQRRPVTIDVEGMSYRTPRSFDIAGAGVVLILVALYSALW